MDKKEESMSYEEAINKAGSGLYRFPLVDVQGIPLMTRIAQNWSSIWAFRPDPSDMLISTYPKAGTTWTQEIVDLLLHNGDADICKRAPTTVRIPFLEINSPPPIPSGLDLLKKMKPPRFIKTHLPIQLVPEGFWENKCKVIYVARNAKDNLVSYYHFDRMNLIQPEPGSWEEYVQKFMKGKLAWGSWYDHVKGYWKEKEKRNILYLFYEDMKEGRLETGPTTSHPFSPRCLMRTTPDKWLTWTFLFEPKYEKRQEESKPALQDKSKINQNVKCSCTNIIHF
ncbi:sulfotransferase 1 family member D1-like isoform X2 [Tachysurus fulvidraco]|uniref:sulfotransferase 1 family member D1-like isoform X2 n=1 Tax=Tachysurus fulvidraco TaxID=1234273 RepID=UPI000F50F518|nr:sulfotransferase 1 family member D1-like isoform X2 [Tachysurus fulvidraco]